MAGLLTFGSLEEALRAGYQVYDRTGDGYLVRTRTASGWALALVVIRPNRELRGTDAGADPEC